MYAGTEIDNYLPKNPTVRNSDLSLSLREHKSYKFYGFISKLANTSCTSVILPALFQIIIFSNRQWIGISFVHNHYQNKTLIVLRNHQRFGIEMKLSFAL